MRANAFYTPVLLAAVAALTVIPPTGVHAEPQDVPPVEAGSGDSEPAYAEPIESLTAGGRYQLMEINDKVVRLDTREGTFDLCQMEEGQWNCGVTRDQRAEFEAKIATLTRRIEKLEKARAADVAAAERSTIRTGTVQPVTSPLPQPSAAPAPPLPAQPSAFDQVAEIVPPVEVGRTPGEPMAISPVPIEPKKRGLVDRVTGWLPDIGW